MAICKTAELSNQALAWAVGIAEGYELSVYGVAPSISARRPGLGVIAPWRPHYYWNQGGPIIERERIQLSYLGPEWEGWCDADGLFCKGPTPLIATMRCYVASKLGDEVDIPEGLK